MHHSAFAETLVDITSDQLLREHQLTAIHIGHAQWIDRFQHLIGDFPDHTIDCDFAIEAVSRHENFAALLQQAHLRDIHSILDEADLIYRYHWACVDARLKQAPMPAGMNASVVMERHAALNWLIDSDGQNDWDNPDVST